MPDRSRRLPLGGITALAALLAPSASAGAQTPVPEHLRRFSPPWPDDRTPVRLMHVPDEHRLLGGWTGSGDSVTAVLRFPDMARWTVPDPCPRAWCDGKLLVVITTGNAPDLHRSVWSLRREMFRAGAEQPQKETFTPVPPPAGYTEAWEHARLVSVPMLPDNAALYLRAMPDGQPLELVRCAAGGYGTPVRCDTETVLDGVPAVHVQYSFGAEHWQDRDAIRAAVMQTVRSWL